MASTPIVEVPEIPVNEYAAGEPVVTVAPAMPAVPTGQEMTDADAPKLAANNALTGKQEHCK